MTTAIVLYNPAIAYLHGDHSIMECYVMEYFGVGCLGCFLQKYKPYVCCNGPCETCTMEDCPNVGKRLKGACGGSVLYLPGAQ
jgi:hypothetical protein